MDHRLASLAVAIACAVHVGCNEDPPPNAPPAQGDTRAQGPAGPAGPTGAVGATGPQGVTGPTGTAGTAGATGPMGPEGMVGPAGATGMVGPAGATGMAGSVGPTGPTGADGTSGPAGPTGATGGALGNALLVGVDGVNMLLDARPPGCNTSAYVVPPGKIFALSRIYSDQPTFPEIGGVRLSFDRGIFSPPILLEAGARIRSLCAPNSLTFGFSGYLTDEVVGLTPRRITVRSRNEWDSATGQYNCVHLDEYVVPPNRNLMISLADTSRGGAFANRLEIDGIPVLCGGVSPTPYGCSPPVVAGAGETIRVVCAGPGPGEVSWSVFGYEQ